MSGVMNFNSFSRGPTSERVYVYACRYVYKRVHQKYYGEVKYEGSTRNLRVQKWQRIFHPTSNCRQINLTIKTNKISRQAVQTRQFSIFFRNTIFYSRFHKIKKKHYFSSRGHHIVFLYFRHTSSHLIFLFEQYNCDVFRNK